MSADASVIPKATDEQSCADWQNALRALAQHKSVGFPTETVWGLGAAATSEQAVVALNALKGRETSKPLQVSCLDIEQALTLALPGQRALQRLCAFLPGPLTLVAWASPACPPWLQYAGKVGLRVPQHPTIQELLRRFGAPLATTSLNPAGQPAARTWQEAQAYALAAALLPDTLANTSEPHPQTSGEGQASTVVDCTNGTILREGALTEQVRAALANLTADLTTGLSEAQINRGHTP